VADVPQDLMSLVGDMPTPDEERAAKIAALQRTKDAGQLRALGLISALSGSKTLEPLRQVADTQAQQLGEEGDKETQRRDSLMGRRFMAALENKKDKELQDYREKELALHNRVADQGHFAPLVTDQGVRILDTRRGSLAPALDEGGKQLTKTTGAGKGGFFGEGIEPIHPDQPPPNLPAAEVSKLRARIAANQNLGSALDEFENAIKSAGGPGARIAGPAAQAIITAHGQLKPVWVESKGFSRFTANEDKLLDQILPVPAGKGVWQFPSSAITAIQQIRKAARADVAENLRIRGLRFSGATQEPSPVQQGSGTPAPAAPTGQRIEKTINGETRYWNGKEWKP
jgi:hypothetical protein